MKRYKLLSLLIVGISFLGAISLLSFKRQDLISPVLGSSKNISDNIWVPKKAAVNFSDAPEITAKAAFFMEINTGEVLYEKNANEKLPIASLVKIMAAIVTLENRELSDRLVVSERASAMEPDKMLLIAGEELTIEELLAGIFLVSANDASEVLAEQVTGRREEFIALMNSKAVFLGMFNTNFINPSGLEEDGNKQLSTAYEVAIMSRYAIKKWPKLVEISSSQHIYIPQTTSHQDYDLYSGINLLTTYPGVVGFKTGYTPEAGLTLVTLAKIEDKEVLGVLLGSTERRDDAKTLLDYSFSSK